MDPDGTEHARLAAGAYGGHEVEGYDIDRELSNRNRTVYVNRETGKATLAFSGTRLGSKRDKMKDLGSDALLALGLHEMSSRFKNARRVGRAAIEKYGRDNVDVTGHSLGGSQALYTNQKLGLDSYSYNPGVSPKMARKGLFDRLTGALFKRPVQANAKIYTTGTDPISILSGATAAKTTKVKQKTKDPHSMLNFL